MPVLCLGTYLAAFSFSSWNSKLWASWSWSRYVVSYWILLEINLLWLCLCSNLFFSLLSLFSLYFSLLSLILFFCLFVFPSIQEHWCNNLYSVSTKIYGCFLQMLLFFNSYSILWGFGGVCTNQTILTAHHDANYIILIAIV